MTIRIERIREGAAAYAVPDVRARYRIRYGDELVDTELEWSPELRKTLSDVSNGDVKSEDRKRLGQNLAELLGPPWSALGAQLADSSGGHETAYVEFVHEAAETAHLPWGLTWATRGEVTLASLGHVVPMHAWPSVTRVRAAEPASEETRILFAWSDAAGGVDHERHLEAIQAACEGAAVSIEVLPNASASRLRAALVAASRGKDAPFSMVHVLCHGDRDTDGEVRLKLSEGDAGPMGLKDVLEPFATSVRTVVLSVCLGGSEKPILGERVGSVARELHQGGIEAVVANQALWSIDGSVEFARTFYAGLVRETLAVGPAFARARTALRGQTKDWMTLQLWSTTADTTRPLTFRPYRGLRRFDAQHARFFAGRELEVADVGRRLDLLGGRGEPRVVFVVGASGVGKSSLLTCGVAASRGAVRDHVVLEARDAKGAGALADWDSVTKDSRLVIVDAFEDAFALPPGDQAALARWLWTTGQARDVVVSVRDGVAEECYRVEVQPGLRLDRVVNGQAPYEEHRAPLSQLDRTNLQSAIEEPARRVGLRFTDGLVAQILDDAGDEPGVLPLVQHTLDLLWQRRSGGELTFEAYRKVGGVGGALQAVGDQLLKDASEGVRLQLHRVLVALVDLRGAEPAARPGSVSELRAQTKVPADFDQAVEQLVDARLIMRQGDRIEPAHSALVRRWARSWPVFASWLDAERPKRAAEEAIAEAVSKRRLLDGAQRRMFASHRKRYGLSPDAARLLLLSRAWVVGQAMVAVIVGLGAVVAGARELLAQRDAAAAARALRDTELVRVAQGTKDDAYAALLLREVSEPFRTRGWLPETFARLQRDLPWLVVPGYLEGCGRQGGRIVCATSASRYETWTWTFDPTTRVGFRRRIEHEGDDVRAAHVQTDGTVVLHTSGEVGSIWDADGTHYTTTMPNGGSVVVHSTRDEQDMWFVDRSSRPRSAMQLARHGTRLMILTGSRDESTLKVYDRDGAPEGWTLTSSQAWSDADMSPDGTLVATASAEGIALFRVGNSQPECQTRGFMRDVRFDEGGAQILGRYEGTVVRYSLQCGQDRQRSHVEVADANPVMWPAGSALLELAKDWQLRMYTPTPLAKETLYGHVAAIALRPTGNPLYVHPEASPDDGLIESGDGVRVQGLPGTRTLRVAPDGRVAVVSDAYGNTLVVPLDPTVDLPPDCATLISDPLDEPVLRCASGELYLWPAGRRTVGEPAERAAWRAKADSLAVADGSRVRWWKGGSTLDVRLDSDVVTLQLDPEGAVLAVLLSTGKVLLWDAPGSDPTEFVTEGGNSLELDSGGAHVLVRGGRPELLRTRHGDSVKIPVEREMVWDSFLVGQGDEQGVLVRRGGTVELWAAEPAADHLVLDDAGDGNVTQVAVSHDRMSFLVSQAGRGTFRVWQAAEVTPAALIRRLDEATRLACLTSGTRTDLLGESFDDAKAAMEACHAARWTAPADTPEPRVLP